MKHCETLYFACNRFWIFVWIFKEYLLYNDISIILIRYSLVFTTFLAIFITCQNATLIFILFLMVSLDTVQFSRSVVSDSLRPHEPQHTRPSCLSPTTGVYPNPCPLSWWCHPTISSSVVPFSSCLQSFPASGFFQMSQLFSAGGQSIRVSASTSIPPMNTQDWSPLGWAGWISLQSKGHSGVFSNTTVQKHQFFGTQPSL